VSDNVVRAPNSEENGFATRRPIMAGACPTCIWGPIAVLTKQALLAYGYDVQICYNCNRQLSVPVVAGALETPPLSDRDVELGDRTAGEIEPGSTGMLPRIHDSQTASQRAAGNPTHFCSTTITCTHCRPKLRARFPSTPILHFTHIPLPGPAAWCQLPPAWSSAVVRGLLGADVVGFQTTRDLEHFLECGRSFGYRVDYTSHTVAADDGRQVRVRVYPASISPEEVRTVLARPALADASRRLSAGHEQQTIVRVDRLDPSKNQLAGFLAFERVLDEHPELHGRVRFNAFLVPSRTDLKVYRTYREKVFGQIGAINARFAARCGGPVIHVFYTNDREQALAAMADADVLLVNSLADGMNLVVKEWAIASVRPGVLVASDRMGVAAEAEASALLVDPTDVAGTARALAKALAMPKSQRQLRLHRLRKRVEAWTAHDWLLAQLRDLDAADVQLLRSAEPTYSLTKGSEKAY
jgi:trehalose-6-phosphate synthase